jgi:hypothetical protein
MHSTYQGPADVTAHLDPVELLHVREGGLGPLRELSDGDQALTRGKGLGLQGRNMDLREQMRPQKQGRRSVPSRIPVGSCV